MQTDNITPITKQSLPQNQNPEIQPDSPKTQKQSLDTKPSSIEKTVAKQKSKSPMKQESKVIQNQREKINHENKEDIEDEMEKYFEEYAVMQSIPSSKKLQADEKIPKKSSDNNRKQESSGGEEEDESNIDQEELYRYKQLENKLNFALNKIEICKDSSRKSLKMTNDDSDELYKRFEYYQKKKRDDLERKKQEKDEQEVRQLQKKPSINPTSTKIVGNLEPIHERYQRILNQKQKKLEEERLKIKKQKQEQEELFFKDFEQRNKRPEKTRTTEQFYDGLMRWKESNIEKNSKKLESNRQEELANATFQPSINERSKKLMAKKPAREPIFVREPKPKVVVQEYSFKPKINKKVPNFN